MEEEEQVNGRVAKETMEERKDPRAANLNGTVTKTKDPMETQLKAEVKGKVRANLDVADDISSHSVSHKVLFARDGFSNLSSKTGSQAASAEDLILNCVNFIVG